MPNPPVARGAGENGDDEQTVRTPTACPPQAKIRASVQFRRATERLHELGVRPFAEALLAVSEGRDALSVVASYAEIDPRLLDEFGGRTWPPAPLEPVE
jgi:hypothetical protein